MVECIFAQVGSFTIYDFSCLKILYHFSHSVINFHDNKRKS